MTNMVTFILPGGSAHNKDWAEKTAKEINLPHEIRPVFWSHWDDPEKEFDPKEKVRLIVDVARQNSINIIAKSIGSLVACYIIDQVPEKIQKIILCGIPLNDLNDEDKEVYRSVLSGFPAERVLCFQNSEDPHASFEEVNNFLTKINSEIKIIEKPGDDHEYPYFKEFQEFLSG